MNNDDDVDRLEEVNLTVSAATKLAEDPEGFLRALEAFRAEDAERFQSELSRVDLLAHCHRICHWFCSKHCVFVCRKLAGPIEPGAEWDPKEVLEFTRAVQAIAADQVLLAALVKAVDDVDVETFQALLKRVGFDQRYWHQLCHWLHHVKCRRKCRKMCPNLPSITKVGLIPASQINAAGYGAGPSVPVGPTPADSNSPGPYGDHVWGAQTFIQGSIFGIANVAKYRVESRITAGPGPWVPMLNPVPDFDAALLPGNPDFLRVPDAQGWFLVSDMKTYIADLAYMTTTAGPDGPYQLRLTVENGIGQQFSSGLIPIRVDNTGPTDFTFVITQSGDPLPCCGSKVVQENGPLKITVTGWDTNFAAMSITLRGGCNESYPVFSKTYDGDVTDTGAPPPGITFDYDPWAAGVKPCCYVLDVEVVDRAIVDNTLYAAHRVSSVRSITIA